LRLVSGGLRIDARGEGRALIVLKSASGEEIAIERSPDQLAELRSAIDATEAAAKEAAAQAEKEAAERAAAEAAAQAAAAEKAEAPADDPVEPAASSDQGSGA